MASSRSWARQRLGWVDGNRGGSGGEAFSQGGPLVEFHTEGMRAEIGHPPSGSGAWRP
jgi:hypothetical protein